MIHIPETSSSMLLTWCLRIQLGCLHFHMFCECVLSTSLTIIAFLGHLLPWCNSWAACFSKHITGERLFSSESKELWKSHSKAIPGWGQVTCLWWGCEAQRFLCPFLKAALQPFHVIPLYSQALSTFFSALLNFPLAFQLLSRRCIWHLSVFPATECRRKVLT